MIIFLIASLFILLLLGVPIYIALVAASAFSLIIFTDLSLVILIQRIFGGMDQFILMSLPFFVLGANAMNVGGLSERIINLAKALTGHLYGGLAITTQTASTFFGALSGSGPATVVAIGRTLYPGLLREGYSKTFANALIIQSGSVSLLIPPSITLIIYASTTNTSVGELFMAGITAGLVFALIVTVYIYIEARHKNIKGGERASFYTLLATLKEASWSLGVPILIIGGIFSGLFTPTEAAGVSAVYAIVVGAFIYRQIDWKNLYQLCLDSAITSAQILIIVGSASAFSWVLTVDQFPRLLASFLTDNFTTAFTFLIFLNIFLLILGMFMDATIGLVIIAPLVLPTAVALGISPIHLGIIIVFNLAIGQFTPPFGLNIFVGSGITGVSTKESIPGLTKFILVAFVALIIVTYIPQISTFLPNLFY